MVMGDRDRRVDNVAPHLHERTVGSQPRRLSRLAAAHSRPRTVQQHRLEMPHQRAHVNALASLAFDLGARLAPLRQADIVPVGRTVAGRLEPRPIDEGLHQHRAHAVMRLPVIGQAPHRHRQRLGGQTVDLHPRKNQKPTVAHHPVEMFLPGPVLPSNPFIAARYRRRRRLEQQTAESTSPPIEDHIAQVGPERAPVAQVMMPVNDLVPFLDGLLAGHHLKRQRRQWLQPTFDRRTRRRAARPDRLPERAALHRLARWRQRHDAERLKLLKQPKTGLNPVVSLRREPAEMLADRVAQFTPAQGRKPLDRRLDAGDLPARQPLAEERR